VGGMGGGGRCFDEGDQQIVTAMCSHLAVVIERVSQDAENKSQLGDALHATQSLQGEW
jgi:hypothetical protein